MEAQRTEPPVRAYGRRGDGTALSPFKVDSSVEVVTHATAMTGHSASKTLTLFFANSSGEFHSQA